jgi:hypothetical protein
MIVCLNQATESERSLVLVLPEEQSGQNKESIGKIVPERSTRAQGIKAKAAKECWSMERNDLMLWSIRNDLMLRSIRNVLNNRLIAQILPGQCRVDEMPGAIGLDAQGCASADKSCLAGGLFPIRTLAGIKAIEGAKNPQWITFSERENQASERGFACMCSLSGSLIQKRAQLREIPSYAGNIGVRTIDADSLHNVFLYHRKAG